MSEVRAAANGVHKYAYIDCMRGLAILLVIAMHHGQNFFHYPPLPYFTTFGQLGVQMFFVASAVTLCLSARSRRMEPKPVASFYLRRLFRIAPLYYLGIVLYALLVTTDWGQVWLGDPAAYSARNVLANLLFVHGFVPSAQNSIVPGGWSIGIEMTFYALFPLLFAASDWLARRGAVAAVLVLPVASALANLAGQALITHLTGSRMVNNGFLFYSIANELPVFLIGMSAFVMIERGYAPVRVWPGLLGFAACSALALVWVNRLDPLELALLPTVAAIGFACLLFALRVLRQRTGWVERIGQVSYSMYVFHFLFAWWGTGLVLALAPVAALPVALRYLVSLVLAVGASYALGRLSKVLVEDPSIALGKRVIARMQAARS